MKPSRIFFSFAALGGLLLSHSTAVAAEDNGSFDITIDASRSAAKVSSTMYGIFFEDINFAADGGLYAELIKNRSFEYPNALQGWKQFGKVEVLGDGPFEKNPHYIRLTSPGHRYKYSGVENEGFFGIGLKKDGDYRFGVWARVPFGQEKARIRVELVDPVSNDSDQAFCKERIEITSQEWEKYEVVLHSDRTVEKAVLRIFLETPEVATDLEHVSLFPKDTWMGRENGLRKDLAQALYDLHPGIFRFPGGCIVEGTDIDTRYNWKNSVGPVENRPLNENRWNYTFAHRFYPDYFQSYGLGFYEFFLLSEDIGSEPLPVLNCGLACQYQNSDESANIPVDELGEYIDDALDLIEFANGSTDSEWGSLRAKMGHPAPFNLKYIGIGNEQWGEGYPARLEKFVSAIRKAHPEIKIVGSAGPLPDGEQFDYLWSEMKRLGVDLVDEHYYRPYEWFLEGATRYDGYDRKAPKVFAGEYACHASGKGYNHFNAAIMEAAFMTGLERNADVVEMATYAPLFAHVEGWQWRPDLIWFDNLRSYRTASYYVQQLYSAYRGSEVLKTTCNGAPLTGDGGLYASTVRDGEHIYVKVVNTEGESRDIKINFKGLKRKLSALPDGMVKFCSDNLYEDNILESTEKFTPKEAQIAIKPDGTISVEPHCFAVYKFRVSAAGSN